MQSKTLLGPQQLLKDLQIENKIKSREKKITKRNNNQGIYEKDLHMVIEKRKRDCIEDAGKKLLFLKSSLSFCYEFSSM